MAVAAFTEIARTPMATVIFPRYGQCSVVNVVCDYIIHMSSLCFLTNPKLYRHDDKEGIPPYWALIVILFARFLPWVKCVFSTLFYVLSFERIVCFFSSFAANEQITLDCSFLRLRLFQARG